MKAGTTLDDIAQAVSDLATLMDRRFDAVYQRFDGLDARLDEHSSRLRALETITAQTDNEIHAMHSDIKELYDRTVPA